MKIGDEVQVQEADLENGDNSGDNVPRFDFGILSPVIHDIQGIPLPDLATPDPPNRQNAIPVTNDRRRLPVQDYKVSNRIFLKRQVQMMAISITNSTQMIAKSCRLLHRNCSFLLYWPLSTESGPYLIASCFPSNGDCRLWCSR